MKLVNILTSVFVGGLVTTAALLLLNPGMQKGVEALSDTPPDTDEAPSTTSKISKSTAINGQSGKKVPKKPARPSDEEFYKGHKVHYGAKGGRYYFDEKGIKKYLKPKKK